MNELVYRNNSITTPFATKKAGSLKISLNVFATMLLCFFTLFNLNKTSAALRFITAPLIICFVLMLVPFLNAKKNIRSYIPIFCFGIIVIISTLASDVVSWSATASSLIIFILLYFVATVPNNDVREIRTLLKFYSIVVVLISVWMLFNYVFNYSLNNGRVSITFFDVRKDENYLSAFLSFGFAYYLISFFRLKTRKITNLLFSLIIFFAIFLTGSRAALIAMAISFLIVLIGELAKKEKNILKKALLIIPIIFLPFIYLILRNTSLFDRMTDTEGFSTNIRLKIWSYAIEAFTRKPLIGSGIQSGTYFAQQSVRWYTHSCFVDLITSVGIVGVIFFAIAILGFFINIRKGNKIYMLAIVLSMFIPLFFINGFECATFWFPMILCKLVSKTLKAHSIEEVLL